MNHYFDSKETICETNMTIKLLCIGFTVDRTDIRTDIANSMFINSLTRHIISTKAFSLRCAPTNVSISIICILAYLIISVDIAIVPVTRVILPTIPCRCERKFVMLSISILEITCNRTTITAPILTQKEHLKRL